MAEEQAQHVSKGLECIKAIRANPLCIEEIQEISIIRDTALEEFEPPVSSEQDEEDLDEDINESQKAAGGPAGQSTLCPNSDGFGEADGQDFGRTDVERHEPVSRSDIQCYYVHSHCGEEVEGIQDVDSVLVQSDNNCNPDDSEGTDSADEGASGFSKDDSSKSTANDRGSTSTPVPIRSADVSKMMEDEITSLLGPDNRNKGRENLGRQLTFPKQPKIAETGSDLESIKKGTDAKLISFGTETASTLTNGATPCVPKSPAILSGLNAPVVSAPKSVQNAKMTPRCGPGSGMLPQPALPSNDEDDEEYEDELLTEVLELKDAITKINEDNQLILSKLDAILQLKGEIDSIKKQLNKQNIAISTIEGHISSIMIAIPGFGKSDSESQSEFEFNPELRPIIGRDSGRALAEVLKKVPPNTGKMTQGLAKPGSKRQLLKEMILQPIDPNGSSAIRFNPKDDIPSKSVIGSIIKSSSLDSSHKRNMLDLLKDIKGEKNIREFHQMVLDIIKA
ncbi:phosphoprotein [Phyllostomus bat morbillivirus]|uniref:Phosphoprotein n=1 Tax=Phyllostomus bat morbillivirus TaxID=2853285 RepID=A0AAE9HR38_9MONO|nr:phosphoprotein [Phyllostomus bat morbillivirus]